MYRYLLFGHVGHDAIGGMGDLLFKFNTVDELQKELSNGGKNIGIGLEYQDNFEIYDIKNDKIYWYRKDYDNNSMDGKFDDFIADNLK